MEPLHPPRLLQQTTKNRRVSMGLPGPMAVSHQPIFTQISMVITRGVMITRKGMANQHRIAVGGIELTIGLVDQLKTR